MRLTTKGRFAVTAMIDVAMYQPGGPVALAGIAQRHQISLSYLEQMFSKLRRDGLVASTRGPGGGYALARPAESITVADIVSAVEGRDKPDASCTGTPAVREMTQELWDSLSLRMFDYLQSVSLHSLVVEQLANGKSMPLRKPARRGVFKRPAQGNSGDLAVNSIFALGKSFFAKA